MLPDVSMTSSTFGRMFEVAPVLPMNSSVSSPYAGNPTRIDNSIPAASHVLWCLKMFIVVFL